jgi:hypothetical protein
MRACPRCGARPLYIVDGSRWQGARDRGTDQRGARRHDEAVGDEEPPRSPLPPSDPSPLPMSEDERGRRSVGLAASLVIGLIVVGVIFARTTHDEPNGRSGLAGLRPSEASALPGISPLLPHDPFNRDVVTRSVDHVLDLDTGQVTPLPRAILRSLGETAEGPSAESWYAAAPGGKQLAYVGTDGQGKRQIFVAGRSAGEPSPGVAGSSVRQVTHDPAGATQPAWSPDGTMIAYEGYGGGEVRNLFVLDVATGRSTQITDETFDLCECGLQFTPDGASVVYTDGSGLQSEIRTVPVEGGRSRLLIGVEIGPTNGLLESASNGAISPDGSLVTFVGSESGRHGPGRFVANADGTDRRALPGYASDPAGSWSPDGSQIVCWDGPSFREDGPGARGVILVVDVATGHASRVARGSGAIWLDERTLLVEV